MLNIDSQGPVYLLHIEHLQTYIPNSYIHYAMKDALSLQDDSLLANIILFLASLKLHQ